MKIKYDDLFAKFPNKYVISFKLGELFKDEIRNIDEENYKPNYIFMERAYNKFLKG